MKIILFIFLIIPFSSFAQKKNTAPLIETGVSEKLAVFRKQILSDLNYKFQLTIPDKKSESIAAEETISFYMKKNNAPLQIDFKEQKDHLTEIFLNNKPIPIVFEKEHIIIAHGNFNGNNKVRIVFTAGNLSLNRNEDYLYTLLVPDRARTVFPCFDQPDLKANFQLTLTLPKDWKAVTNAPLLDSSVSGATKTLYYDRSDKISTYLFSFAAGNFKQIRKNISGRTMNFYHRETDTTKIRMSTEPVFQIQADAIKFLEDYTNISYPFKKFDFVAIPDFQYGGMEHVGAILYKSSSLFLDSGATKDELLNRSTLLSHETSHMWFGDLVTMKWFNDVWTKEVFANFMADKITQVALANTTAKTNYDLQFLIDHYPAAYAVDRTKGANPIRQNLENLQDAGSLYGNIIYHKAPIMMRQLELLMGKDEFRNGLREYLKKYAYSNATWPDLIDILARHTTADVKSWNNVWVNRTGRPVFSYFLSTKRNKIEHLVISQKAEDNSAKIWPQFFKIALVYPDHIEELPVQMNAEAEVIKVAEGKEKPQFILFNSSGEGYGIFPVDEKIVSDFSRVDNASMRASSFINLYENMLNGRFIKPAQLLKFYGNILSTEEEELNLRLITAQLSEVFWHYIVPGKRNEIVKNLETDIWKAMQQQNTANKKKILFKTFQSVALTKDAEDTLYNIWKNKIPPSGVKLTEEDYTSLALALAVRDYPDATILSEQQDRIQNPDRKKRLQYLMPALSPDVKVRDAFFASLKQKKNREKEAWVTTALQYLHHPLRAETSEKYLKESLDLLQEIQLTGDIFFPQSWLQATFSSYQTNNAADVVNTFLLGHPNYNLKLKAKILQATDPVFRAIKLLHSD